MGLEVLYINKLLTMVKTERGLLECALCLTPSRGRNRRVQCKNVSVEYKYSVKSKKTLMDWIFTKVSHSHKTLWIKQNISASPLLF